MPDKHALLSASGSDRWIHCTPSARLEERMPEEPSLYAAEGTVAHAKAEAKLRNWIDGHPRKKVACEDGEMDEATTAYKEYVMEVFNKEKKDTPDTDIFVEVQLDLNRWIPGGFGTADCVIVSDTALHIIDFKYGKGVTVNAEKNSQLSLYAAGAIQRYCLMYDFDKVVLHIFQPRKDHISEWTTNTGEILNWLKFTVEPAAKQAIDGKGPQVPGDWCRFCKVRANCRARAQWVQEAAAEDKRLNGLLLSDDEIAALLPKIKPIQDWCDDISAFALNQALEGTHYAGYKLVEGTSRRKITDEQKAITALENNGYTAEQVTETKILGITKLEKLTGKKAFTEILGDLVDKPPGAPVLVPESDKRPELKKAAAEEAFSEELKEAEKTKN